ncbi:hypothetical protein GQ55_8G019200 [Panicum hallii var. hallii]|uniref:Pectinesterase inhibitor domain-containing protein n=1 Tax=Panicum hallii var. hallii TaxID=1504633 RepID=A0A2T7CJQ6_9POAL|nr:hypothetical protein GQ55_8G019200 [Panicum hallii var. hallii]
MASSPYSFSSVSVFVFLLSALLLIVSAPTTLAEVAAAAPVAPLFPICKTVIGAGNRYFDINFCMQALNSDREPDFRYGEARSCLDQAAREAEQCEAEFVRRHVASPLTVEDDCAFKLAKLASALLQHADDD